MADVFVVAWRRLDEVPDDPLPWLLGVARRVLANRRRGTAREHALMARMRSERLTRPPSGIREAPEGAAAVWQALTALSERDREVLLLVAWEGLAPARAARVLGIGAEHVRGAHVPRPATVPAGAGGRDGSATATA